MQKAIQNAHGHDIIKNLWSPLKGRTPFRGNAAEALEQIGATSLPI